MLGGAEVGLGLQLSLKLLEVLETQVQLLQEAGGVRIEGESGGGLMSYRPARELGVEDVVVQLAGGADGLTGLAGGQQAVAAHAALPAADARGQRVEGLLHGGAGEVHSRG